MKKSVPDPIEGEVNPNHPMTQFSRNQWHKIVALLMQKFDVTEVEITSEMVNKMSRGNWTVVMDGRDQKLVIRLLTIEEGERLAREAGGLPA